MNFKFNLGDKVVVPHVGVEGAVDSFRVYHDKSVLVLVRWAVTGSLHEDWFTEKELKMATKKKAASAHPKKKTMPKKKPAKKKTTRRQTRGTGGGLTFR